MIFKQRKLTKTIATLSLGLGLLSPTLSYAADDKGTVHLAYVE